MKDYYILNNVGYCCATITNNFQDTILPEAVRFWEQALMVRQTKEIIRLNRKCESSQVFVKNSLTYCIDSCKPVTLCGEVQVPEDHLDVNIFFFVNICSVAMSLTYNIILGLPRL